MTLPKIGKNCKILQSGTPLDRVCQPCPVTNFSKNRPYRLSLHPSLRTQRAILENEYSKKLPTITPKHAPTALSEKPTCVRGFARLFEGCKGRGRSCG
ncbi:hypothetical protein [Moraxella bovis]|uniref:hypothetical protein n=1 Tax=Moraxella bovis TaxID=476 RepID=UPI002227E58C|nr:hypothetical protein [Moraxella bovis]UYZ91026.1 hypothetical protein LP103_07325 [Moraxella bovis]UYZ91039.1 hypothetical protein LP103_07390 [Moraxella bovis]